MNAQQFLVFLLACGLTLAIVPTAWHAYGPNGHQRQHKRHQRQRDR